MPRGCATAPAVHIRNPLIPSFAPALQIHRPDIIRQHQHEHAIPAWAANTKEFRAAKPSAACRRETLDGSPRCAAPRYSDFSFSSPLTNFTPSTFATDPAPPLNRMKKSALPVSFALPRSMVRRCCKSSLILRHHRIGLRVAASQRGQPASCLRRGTQLRSSRAHKYAARDLSLRASHKSAPDDRRPPRDDPAPTPRPRTSPPCRDRLPQSAPSPACPNRR